MEHNNNIDTLIFDLFGVLFKFDTIPSIRYLGICDIIWYYFRFQQNPFKRALNVLDKMRREVPGEYQDLMTYKGEHLLPESFVNWQKGYTSRAEMVSKIHRYIHLLQSENYFVNDYDRKSIESLLMLFAHPSQLIDSFYPPSYIIDLIEKIYAQKRYKLYIISNIDTETFNLISKRYESFFALFDGFVASCNVHKIKPDPAIYEYAIHKYNLVPERCYFIDDQKENILAAQKLGINTLLCPKPSKLAGILEPLL